MPKPESEHENLIVGGGLVGSLWAVMLRNRGENVSVFEKRADMRRDGSEGGRSINLIVTSRGLHALRRAGIADDIMQLTVPVFGRRMHARDGDTYYQPYGRDRSECNFSISRAKLNMRLLDHAEAAGARLYFENELENVDFETQRATFSHRDHQESYAFEVLYGTDGAGSKARAAMMKALGSDTEDRIEWLTSDYKELLMPAKAKGEYVLEKNALHIWPRGAHMLMALPNLDGSFTMTLYLPKEGADISFANIRDSADLRELFAKEFADAISLMPDFEKEYFENPQGVLGTVRARPWVFSDRCALLGDAAHAVVPFFGQGMNAGFEDCTTLCEQLDAQKDREAAFAAYDRLQRPNGNAIADMAIENFAEMQAKVADPLFLRKKAIEQAIEKAMPEHYRSRYSLVTYSLLPYRQAFEIGEIQKVILSRLADEMPSGDIDLMRAKTFIDADLTPYLAAHGIELGDVFMKMFDPEHIDRR